MTFKVNTSAPGVGNFSSSRLSVSTAQSERQSDGLRSALTQKTKSPDNNDAVELSNKLEGKPEIVDPVVKSIQGFLDVAKSAADRIQELRKEQLDYASEATLYSEGDPRLTQLNTLIQSNQTAIQAVQQDATYAGQPVLNGGTFDTGKYNGSDNVVLGVASGLGQTKDYGFSLLTPTSALSAETTLKEIVPGTEVYSASTESARSAATISAVNLENINSNQSADPGFPTSVEDAEKLASKVRNDIKSKFDTTANQAQAAKDLIELSTKNLDSERVNSLLSSD